MAERQVINKIDEALDRSIGQNPADIPVGSASGVSVLNWLVDTGSLIPPWWSKARDKALSAVWKSNNHLSIAVYNTQAKIVGIPFKIVPRLSGVPRHQDEAAIIQRNLMLSSEFGRGWPVAYGRFIEDLITQDNGAFMEVIGGGEADGPIVGIPVSVRHLDSSRCTRTANPEFPVTYMDDDGKLYKIHYTRVIMMAQMESARKEMNGVGVCATSRAIEIGQTLLDMVRYKQERLGSRPHSQMLVGKGVTAQQIMQALSNIEHGLDAQGLARYARTVAIGSESPDIGIDRIDLHHMEPFNEEVATNLGMFAIAAAFGMDADEIWPVSGKSSSKGEADLRRMRSRGRLPAQITQEIALQFNFKFLPPHLRMEFDFRDDAEDMQRANIRDIRGRNRDRDLGDGAINVRIARMNMVRDGDIAGEQFDEMELNDGRLPDGTPVSILYFSDDAEMSDWLNVGVNPLAISKHEPKEMIATIQGRREGVLASWSAAHGNPTRSAKVRLAFHALDWLEEQYAFAAGMILPPVPMQARRMRTDIRVEPEETSPAQGEQSPAESVQVIDENVPTPGSD